MKNKTISVLFSLIKNIPPWQWVALSVMAVLWAFVLVPPRMKTLSRQPQQQGAAAMDPDRMKTLEKINHHLQSQQKKVELNELNMEVQNMELTEEVDGRRVKSLLPPVTDPGFEKLEDEDQARRVYEDLRGSDAHYRNPVTPEERINTALANKKWVRDYEQHQTQEYVRQFIENARNQGYEVKLNDRLEVVEINRIPKDRVYKGLNSIRRLSGE